MRFFAFILSLFLLLPSCRKGEVNSPSEDVAKEPVEVRFSSGIETIVTQYSLGRAPIEGETLPVGLNVGIFGIKAKSSNWGNYNITSLTQKNLNNEKYTVYDGGVLFQNKIAEYPTKDTGYDGLVFYGYHPYMEDVTDKYYDFMRDSYYIPVTLDYKDMSNSVDYLYTGRKEQLTPTGDHTVTLSFKHAMGRIRFIFEKTTSDAILEGLAISAYCGVEGKMFIDTGDCIPNDYEKTQYRYVVNKNMNSENDIIVDFMLYPDIDISQITCYINSKPYTLYTQSSSKKINLTKGEIVEMYVKFSPKEVKVEGNIIGWGNQGVVDNVNIDEETGEVTHE